MSKDMSKDAPTTNVLVKPGDLWRIYAKAVGGKAHDGKTLPTYVKLGGQQKGWIAVADAMDKRFHDALVAMDKKLHDELAANEKTKGENESLQRIDSSNADTYEQLPYDIVKVKALQWTGDNITEMEKFTGFKNISKGKRFRLETTIAVGPNTYNVTDYVVKHGNGIYPLRENEFLRRHKKASV